MSTNDHTASDLTADWPSIPGTTAEIHATLIETADHMRRRFDAARTTAEQSAEKPSQ